MYMICHSHRNRTVLTSPLSLFIFPSWTISLLPFNFRLQTPFGLPSCPSFHVERLELAVIGLWSHFTLFVKDGVYSRCLGASCKPTYYT